MKALVFGADGQLGRALVSTRPDGVELVGIGRSDCDIIDQTKVSAILSDVRPDLVINAAAFTAVDGAEEQQSLAHAVNCTAPGHIAAAARKIEAQMVHVSTDYVFDGSASTPYRPDDAPAPLNVYGRTKLAGERAVVSAHDEALIVRTAWVYAAHGNSFLTTMLRLMQERSEISVVEDQIGTPTYARSLAEGIWALAKRKAGGIWHFTDSGCASWYDFAVAIYEEARAAQLVTRTWPFAPFRQTIIQRRHAGRAFHCLIRIEHGQRLALRLRIGELTSGSPSRSLPNLANLLVTGGAGFIGTNFVRYWHATHPDDRIVVLDALTYAAKRSNIDRVGDVELVVGDICDTALVDRVMNDNSIDTIVHFAAESHVDRSIDGPDAFIRTNIEGTHSLLKASKQAWLDRGTGRPHRFHHISTDEVYGSLGPDEAPFTENTQYAPNSPYSASKAASDHLVRAYHHTFGLQTTTTNCSNNYGPYQFPEKLIPLILINCLTGRPLPIYGDGLNRRDWLHVEDHCRGIELALLKGASGETYNIGGGTELPNLAVVEAICRGVDGAFAQDRQLAARFPNAPAASGMPSESLISFVKDRPGHDRRYAIDETKARHDLGYEPRYDFTRGLQETLEWYLENEEWWTAQR